MASVTTAAANLIIRMASNNKHSDFHISLPLSSTVYELKQNLSLTHPTKPPPKNQRLIYSGKLLEDSTKLDQIFKPTVRLITATIHMVLSAEIPTAKSTPTTTTHVSQNESELRQRTTNAQTATNSLCPNRNNEKETRDILHSSAYEEYYEQLNNYNQQLQSFMMGPSNPNSINNMAYLQYCSIYYSMHQNLLSAQTGNTSGIYNPFFTIPSNSNQSQNVTQSQNATINDSHRPPSPVQPPEAPVPLERPQAERPHNEREDDLLGTLHMLAELFVLCSIIYFYSTFHRFLIVFIIFAILYFHCRGYLTLSRRRRRPVIRHPTPPPVGTQPRRQQPAQAQPDANQPDIPLQQPVERSQENVEQTPIPNAPNDLLNANDIQHGNLTPGAPVPIVNDNHITPIRLFFIAITTIFSSLIPERPQQRL